MSVFVKTTPALKPKTLNSMYIAYMYAFILVVLLLTQLFNFNDFLILIESFGLPGGEPVARLSGGVIVTSELLALPFLLRVDLSPLMRVVSMVLGWVVPSAWLKISLWLVLTENTVMNAGILGPDITLTPGWWAVLFCVWLGILAAWSSWGLWPIKQSNKRK